MPNDLFLVETDSPYISPEPFRGEINRTSNIKYIISKIAEVKEMSFEEESRKCKASCPICGRGLCRAAPHSVVEIYCPKCKSPLLVSFENNGFSAKIIENTGEHKSDPGAVC